MFLSPYWIIWYQKSIDWYQSFELVFRYITQRLLLSWMHCKENANHEQIRIAFTLRSRVFALQRHMKGRGIPAVVVTANPQWKL